MKHLPPSGLAGRGSRPTFRRYEMFFLEGLRESQRNPANASRFPSVTEAGTALSPASTLDGNPCRPWFSCPDSRAVSRAGTCCNRRAHGWQAAPRWSASTFGARLQAGRSPAATITWIGCGISPTPAWRWPISTQASGTGASLWQDPYTDLPRNTTSRCRKDHQGFRSVGQPATLPQRSHPTCPSNRVGGFTSRRTAQRRLLPSFRPDIKGCNVSGGIR